MAYFKFEKLDVWNRSVDWTDTLFDIAENLPKQYQYSLGEQLRRAALSVPTNIAEGSGRPLGKQSAYFYQIAKGSVYEVVSLLVICGKRQLLDGEKYRELRNEGNEIASMLTKMADA